MANKSPYKALLIEGDQKQADLYSDLIREVGDCQVDVISHVESSLTWLDRFSYHLVVIDASLGDSRIGPLSLLETVKRVSPATSVLLISSTATVEESVAAVRLGAEDYLKKPINIEAFRLAVRRSLDKKRIFEEGSGAEAYLNLINSCQMISASLDQSRIFGIVQSFFARELRADHSAVYRREGDRLVRNEESGARKDRAMEEILDISIQANNPITRMQNGDDVFCFLERGQLTPALFVFRFRCVGEPEYYCVVLSPESPQSPDTFPGRLKMLRTQIEVTGKNIEQYLGVQSLVYVDDATGLYNTRYLHNILEREIAQAEVTHSSFAVLFIDGDHFKSVNDNYGHMAGTKLLHELGSRLKRFVRGNDTVFRYGGDEFVAILSPSDLNTAYQVAERVRKSVEKHTFLTDEGLNIHVTISIGVALFPDHASTKKAIIEAADHAMYTAKRTTRNTVFIAPLPKNAAKVTKISRARAKKKR